MRVSKGVGGVSTKWLTEGWSKHEQTIVLFCYTPVLSQSLKRFHFFHHVIMKCSPLHLFPSYNPYYLCGACWINQSAGPHRNFFWQRKFWAADVDRQPSEPISVVRSATPSTSPANGNIEGVSDWGSMSGVDLRGLRRKQGQTPSLEVKNSHLLKVQTLLLFSQTGLLSDHFFSVSDICFEVEWTLR